MADDDDPRRIAEQYNRLWEGKGDVDKEMLVRVLGDAVNALEDDGIPHLVMGGVVAALAGRPRFTHDIDFLVKGQDARPALGALERAGFVTDETEPQWLYKAVKDGVLVDVIFRSSGDVLLDDEMLDRAAEREFEGVTVRAIPIEDFIIIKALAHEENTGRHWYDALALLANQDVDWDYLVRRSVRRGPHRMLSLLFYAKSSDIVVPDRVIHELYGVVFEPERAERVTRRASDRESSS
ncbi:MAG TPA: nucleotidyl transferase AbiEii/AbiGii toxin family protein [Acidimicrobiales bacterium]|nr:nucleotidyl transferase AbiEii/AbiGii toxin family protein [Acidimicrobiales bacterium]